VAANVSISAITFGSRLRLLFEAGDVVVIVGPNNVGKSRFLGDTYALLRGEVESPIIKDVELTKSGSVDHVLTLLEQRSVIRRDTPNNRLFQGLEFSAHESNIKHFWEQPNRLGDLTPAFSVLVNTESRLRITNPPANIPLPNEAPSHPIH
jgi:predicted ATPase